MNVTCPDCQTTYRVDPAKIPEEGVIALCARCPGEFPVRALAGVTGHAAAGETGAASAPEFAGAAEAGDEGDREWSTKFEPENGWGENGSYEADSATEIEKTRYGTGEDSDEAHSEGSIGRSPTDVYGEDGVVGPEAASIALDEGTAAVQPESDFSHEDAVGSATDSAIRQEYPARPEAGPEVDPTRFGAVELDGDLPAESEGAWEPAERGTDTIELSDDTDAQGAEADSAYAAEQASTGDSGHVTASVEYEDADSERFESAHSVTGAADEVVDEAEAAPLEETEDPEPVAAEVPERGDLRTTEEEAVRAGFSAAPVSRSDAGDLPPPPFGSADPHARARRLARALVSDIIVYHPDRRERSLKDGSLRQEFREEIRKSWDEYVAHVGDDIARQTPYFREALNDLLAGGSRLF